MLLVLLWQLLLEYCTIISKLFARLPIMKAYNTKELPPFLQQIGMNASALEAHALFTGLQCNARAPSEGKNTLIPAWCEQLALEIDWRNALDKEAVQVLDQFYQYIGNTLRNTQMTFALPINDNAPVVEQVEDLALWVQGFLYAFSLAGEQSLRQRNQQSREMVADLVQISRAMDYQLDDEQDDQQSLIELTEYVKVVVISLFDERHLYPE